MGIQEELGKYEKVVEELEELEQNADALLLGRCAMGNYKNHSSICNKLSNQLMVANAEGQVVYPVVVVEVDGIRGSGLLDKGAGSSYASAAPISKLNRKPDRREYKRIEMITTCTSQKIEMYKVQVSNTKGVFSLPTTLSKVDK